MFSNENISQSGIFDFSVYPLTEVSELTVKGENKKGLLIVLTGQETGELSFLEKVLGAVGYDLRQDSLTVFVTPLQKFSSSELCHAHGIGHLLFFGVPPKQAGLHFQTQKYAPVQFAGKHYLFADSLADIEASPALKRPLWEGLKAVFGK